MNKLIKSLLFVVLSTTVVFAADSAPADNSSKSTATTETAKSSKLSDASADFLRFALAKAEKYSGKVEDAIGKGVDLAVQEAPETARQWLTWRAWYHGMYLAVPFSLFIIFSVICLFCLKRGNFDSEGDGFAWASIWFGCFSAISFLATLFNFDHLFSLVQIWVAPRIYMIEELIKLTK